MTYDSYDLMAIISAIGGTMGLFIGYSFRDSWSLLLKNVLFCMSLVSKRSPFKGDVKTTSREENQSLTNQELSKEIDKLKAEVARIPLMEKELLALKMASMDRSY